MRPKRSGESAELERTLLPSTDFAVPPNPSPLPRAIETRRPPLLGAEVQAITASAAQAEIVEAAGLSHRDPRALGRLVYDRMLAGAEVVSLHGFEMLLRPSIALPTGDRRGERLDRAELGARLAQITQIVRDFAKRHDKDTLEELVKDGEVIALFREAYKEALGVEPVASDDLSIGRLIEDFGEQLASHAERPLNVTVARATERADREQLTRFFGAILGEISEAGLARESAVLGGFNAKGASLALHDAAASFPEMKRQGVMSGMGIFEEVAPVDIGTILGVRPGDEDDLYLELTARGFLIAAGIGPQGKAQVEHHLREGGVAIVAEGFAADEVRVDGDSENLLRVPAYLGSLEEIGKLAGKEIVARYRARRIEQAKAGPGAIPLHEAPGEIVDVEECARRASLRLRVQQLVSAARGWLLDRGMARADVERLLPGLTDELVRRTAGIDPFKETAVWQAQVKQAFRLASDATRTLSETEFLDVFMAAWFSFGEGEEPPAYFEKNRREFPEIVSLIDPSEEHTFDVSKYVDFRLDPLTKAFLGKDGPSVEVFLGSRRELLAYYRAKGFKFVHSARRVHGLEFSILRNQECTKMVVQGVESPERLIQVGTFLKSKGVDIEPGMVRGDIERVQATNRTKLEWRIASLGRPIAGVVLGNREHAVEQLAAMMGVSPETMKSKTTCHQVGPFKFQAIEVLPAGSSKPHVLLCFEPALGEATRDVVLSCARLGARNFAQAGDAASLLRGDQVGAMHYVLGVHDGEEIFDWSDIPGLQLIPVPGLPMVRSYNSSSPMEQNRLWAARAMASGAANTHQEARALHQGLAIAARLHPGEYHLQPTLYQRDVMGAGKIETGRPGSSYAQAVHGLCANFFDHLGLAEARLSDGRVVRDLGARPGLSARQAQSAMDLSEIEVKLPDLSTMADSQVASTVEQFRGQKRVLRFQATRFDDPDREKFSSFLDGLDTDKYWVVLDVEEPYHGEMNDLSLELGYETIVVGTTDDLVENRLLSSPTFYLKHDAAEQKLATWEDLIRDGSEDFDANPAQHYDVRVGPPNADPSPRDAMTLGSPGRIDLDDVEAESVAGISAAMMEETRRALSRIEVAINWRRRRLGLPPARFHALENIQKFFAGRTPSVWSGASAAWVNVAHESQEEVRRLIEIMALVERPDKVVQVTGASEYGPEAIVQEVVTRRGRKFDLLGWITENTDVSGLELMQAFDQLTPPWQAALLDSNVDARVKKMLLPLASKESPPQLASSTLASSTDPSFKERINLHLACPESEKKSLLASLRESGEVALADVFECIFSGKTKWEPSDHIEDFTPVCINWRGQGRQLVRKLAGENRGGVTNIGGGAGLVDQIRLQFGLGVMVHLMDHLEPSPEAVSAGKTAGASVDMAKIFPAHAFSDVRELCERKGLIQTYERVKHKARISGFDLDTLEGARGFAAHVGAQ